ncbi:MAG: hypothetical protein ACTHQE_15575, partial [Thermomicrobiales bacterium]
MPDVRRRFPLLQPDLSRRRAIQVAAGAGAAVAGYAAAAAGIAAQAPPGATPEASPTASGRSVESWFVVSPQDPAGG